MTKSTLGHVTLNMSFCIRWDRWVTLSIQERLGHETSMHYFSCSGGTGKDLTKSTSGHVTLKFFLHPMGFADHVVHSGESGP
jgi:hypothetical protein